MKENAIKRLNEWRERKADLFAFNKVEHSFGKALKKLIMIKEESDELSEQDSLDSSKVKGRTSNFNK